MTIKVNFFRKQPLARILASVSIVLAVGGCATVKDWFSLEPNSDIVEANRPATEELVASDVPELLSPELNSEPNQEKEKTSPALGSDAISAEKNSVADEEVAPLTEAPVLTVKDSAPAKKGPSPLLEFVEAIDGGVIYSTSRLHELVETIIGTDRLQLKRPTAVAVRDGQMYVVDMGLDLVVRIDLMTRAADVLVELGSITKGDVADIFIASDMSFYITDTEAGQVLQFDAKGKLKRTLVNRLNMAFPVAINEDQLTGDIYIADGFFDHVLVFNQLGELFASIGGRGVNPGEFLNITSMAVGPDGFYIGARVGEHVQVMKGTGEYLYSLEQGPVVFPLGMAATDDFRVYVSDYWDNSIKVFERGRFVESVGGTGVIPGKFKRITDLFLDNDLLYAVDSLNGRVQVLRIQEKAKQPIAFDQ